ncbi:helix-turn-helix domain-containing protein [Nocardioides panacisoli]|uniref:winged helix-turn-helix domain-containing protein n=1 Tax=Nocardioides panacisoli TaxID=627624 RepID=UPI001C63380A|nr:helix-turn-helix domain-containing protein [Nocardioides panacisoli]QYJ02846.1 helix-turn-helix domain-containing protein [Nocardioides panacisoli]
MATYDDPRVLRAIAHPTRNRVLHELSAAGSLRAADIARLLDIPANQASFHLRQLAKYELVEEDPEAARDRRDRVWRLVDREGISFRTEDMLAQPGGKAAYTVFRRSAVAWGHHLVEQAFSRPEGDRVERKNVSEHSLRLTPEEADELATELNDVIGRWRDRNATARGSDEPDDRETYSLLQLLQPYPGLPEATEE